MIMGFGKRVLRIISGPETDEVTGGWKKITVCRVPQILADRVIKSRKVEWESHVERMEA
jgi:hypothetical protein